MRRHSGRGETAFEDGALPDDVFGVREVLQVMPVLEMARVGGTAGGCPGSHEADEVVQASGDGVYQDGPVPGDAVESTGVGGEAVPPFV
jgi:hypothetical protein